MCVCVLGGMLAVAGLLEEEEAAAPAGSASPSPSRGGRGRRVPPPQAKPTTSGVLLPPRMMPTAACVRVTDCRRRLRAARAGGRARARGRDERERASLRSSHRHHPASTHQAPVSSSPSSPSANSGAATLPRPPYQLAGAVGLSVLTRALASGRSIRLRVHSFEGPPGAGKRRRGRSGPRHLPWTSQQLPCYAAVVVAQRRNG